jgi:hypothetical protein
MSLDFTSDILPFFDTNLVNDANYQSPGNFNITTILAGTVPVDHVNVSVAGSYTSPVTASASSGLATFSVFMKVVSISSIASAGTGYAPNDILNLNGGTFTSRGQVTVSTVKLVSATINNGGTGYGDTSTFDVTVTGGTHTTTAVVNVSTDSSGVVTTVNSITTPGSYTVLPTLTGNAVTGDDGTNHGTGLTLNLVFGILSANISAAGIYSNFPSNPVSTTTTGSGTGATFTLAWGVDSISVLDGGSYEVGSPPTINFSSGTAAATAVLASTPATHVDTQKLLLIIEILRSYISESTNPVQLKDLHEVLRKIMKTMKFGGKTTYNASTFASNALNSAMNYIAKNPTHGGATI